MAKQSKLSTTFDLDAARVAAIAQDLRIGVADVNVEKSDHDEAKAAAKMAGDMVENKRVTIMTQIAELSIAGAWTLPEIESALKSAAVDNTGAKTEGSIKTFLYEIGYAANPLVRENFRTINEVVDLAWRNEQESITADPGAARPVSKWQSRKYHALTGAMKAAIKGILIQQESDLVEYARENDPAHNCKKVFKRLETMREAIFAFHIDFPVDNIGAALDLLAKVTVEELDAAHKRKLAETAEVVDDIISTTPIVNTPAPVVKSSPFVTPTKIAPVVINSPAPKPAPVIDATKDVLGEIDAMDPDNLLGDNLEMRAA